MDASARSIVTPPPSASYSASEGIGGRGLGNLVRPESPRATRFPGALDRPGGQAGDRILRSPRSAPPSYSCRHEPIGLFAPFHRPSVPM